MAAITIIHLLFLNQTGSNNLLGLNKNRQDPIPPIFYRKKHPRIRNHNHYYRYQPHGRSRLYASKPSSITSTYPTTMIRPIRISNPTINPKQTRTDNQISNIRRSHVTYPPQSDYVFARNTSHVQLIQHGWGHFNGHKVA